MKKGLFIILNLISVIIEYTIIYLFFRFILKKVFLISIIMTFIIFILMVLIVVYANIVLRKSKIEDKSRPCEEEIIKIINKCSEIYNKKFYLHYVSAPQPNPAWCISNHIYINNQYRCSNIYLPGVVAHELGHAISGISNYTFIPSLKISTLISRVFYLTIISLINIDKKITNIIARIFYIPFYIINLNNLIFTYHFLKEDEFTANSVAVKLGYGEYLRCYYATVLKYDDNKLFRKADLMHPSIKLMIEKINFELGIKKELVDIYYINNILMLANIKTKTFNIPKFITEIYPNSINSSCLVKITSDYVEKIHYNAFKGCPNIEVLSFENVKEFPVSVISSLDKLEAIKIDDLNVLNNIYIKYPNRIFSKKVYQVLVKNGIIKEDE